MLSRFNQILHLNVLSVRLCRVDRFYIEVRHLAAMSFAPADRFATLKPREAWASLVEMKRKYGATDLCAGYPDFPPPDFVSAALKEASCNIDTTQYARIAGSLRLVRAVSEIHGLEFGRKLDCEKEVYVTPGAYVALTLSMQCYVNPGDEVLLIEPFFPAFYAICEFVGAKPVSVPLTAEYDGEGLQTGWALEKSMLSDKITAKTKAIVLNSPHNPTGKVFSKAQLQMVADVCIKHNMLCFSDEVYDNVVFPGNQHIRIASIPGMWDRTITICSAGKMFGITGWRVGWIVAPTALLSTINCIHGITCECTTAPPQEAVAICLEKCIEDRKAIQDGLATTSFLPSRCEQLMSTVQRLEVAFQAAGFHVIPSQGSIFFLVDWRNCKDRMGIKGSTMQEEYDQMIKYFYEHGVAVAPVVPFYSDNNPVACQYIRICVWRSKDTIDAAIQKLANFYN